MKWQPPVLAKLLAKLKQLFVHPAFEQEEEKARTARLLRLILWIILIGSIVYILMGIFIAGDMARRIAILAPLILMAAWMIYLLQRGYILSACYLTLSILWLAFAAAAWTSIGVRSPGFSGFAIVVLFSGLLLGRGAALGVAVLSSLAGLLMIFISSSDPGRSPQFLPSELYIWVTQSTYFLVIAILLGLSTHSLRQANRRANQEIAERERIERALRESERRFREMLENIQLVAVMLDREGRITFCNEHLLQLTGWEIDEVMDQDWFELFIPPDENVRAFYFESIDLGIMPAHYENHILTHSGELRLISWNNTLLRDELGEIIGTSSIGEDITERKRAEEQLQRQLQRLNTLRLIDMTITNSLDLRFTLNILVKQVLTQLNVDAAAILLFKPSSQKLEYGHGSGFISHTIENVRLRLGQGPAGRAALERRTVQYPDPSEGEQLFGFAHFLEREGFCAYYGTPLISKGEIKGVLEIFHRTPLEVNPEWLDFYETLAGQAAIAIDNAELFENLQRVNLDLTMTYDITLEGWVRALDLRDQVTEGNTLHLADMTVRLARHLGIKDETLVHIRRGALLHDIGKIGIPDQILHKPSTLTIQEWEVMKKHPLYAFDLLSPIAYLRNALDIPYCHHEKWDGSGYPRGLQGEQIPLAARIFTVIDVWEAMQSERPYRLALSDDEARGYLVSQIGIHFDAWVVEGFMSMISSERASLDLQEL